MLPPAHGGDPGSGDGVVQLAGMVLEDETVESVLQVIVRLAAADLPGVDGAGAALAEAPDDGAFVGADAIRAADRSQHQSGRGPVPDALRRAGRHNADIEVGQDQWPEFATAARAAGLHSVLAIPLFAQGRTIGVLALYSTAKRAFGTPEVQAAEALARQASVTLYNAMSVVRTRLTNHHLEESLASRGTIGQAQGILMATRRCGASQAWEVLRRRSQNENRKVRDVAADVVAEYERSLGSP